MYNRLLEILRINWIQTLLFNFITFDVYTAIHLPVLIYGVCYFKTHKGAIQISKLRRGMMIIGRIPNSYIYGNLSVYPSVIRILGTIKLEGDTGRVQLGGGIKLVVGESASLIFGDDVSIGQNSLICCSKCIEFANRISVSWDCQFYDTDFHYMLSPHNTIMDNKKCVYIGDNVWIGNRCTIQKGSLPAFAIVGSNSVVTHDYCNEKSGIYVGTPAKLIKQGCSRIFGAKYEKIIDDYFKENKSYNTLDASGYPIFDQIIKARSDYV